MRRFSPMGCLVALAVMAFPGGALRAQEAQTGACFNIVMGNTDKSEVGAFLLNRCSGESWILMRARQSAKGGRSYRWSHIDAGPSGPPSPPAERATANSSKCFTFQGRRFCE
jgi:hypothetical protein